MKGYCMVDSEDDPNGDGNGEGGSGRPDDAGSTRASDVGEPEWMPDDGDADGGDADWMPEGGDGSAGESDDGEYSSGESDDGGWNPDDIEVEPGFEGDGTSGGAADVVDEPGEVLTDDYWFEGERNITTPRGTALLYALSAAGLYASSFIFAAIGVAFVAPLAAQTFIDLVLNGVFFFSIPITGFLAAGVAIEAYLFVGDGDVPETTIPLALLIPVLLHVSLFFVEFVELGYTQATLAELFASNPTFSQLLLWPPVIMGTVFAVIVYRTTVAERARGDGTSGGLFDVR